MNFIKIVGVVMLFTMFVVGHVLAEENTVNQNAQTNCPVMGGTINKDLHTDYEGKRVYFCCEGCLPEFQKNPAKYVNKLENEGVTIEKISEAGFNQESSPGTDASGKKSDACGDCGCDS